MLFLWERREMHSSLLGGNLRDTDHLEYSVMNGEIMFKSILNKYDEMLCTGVIWNRTVIIGGLLLTV
jgi:hypothetical protein